MISIGFSTRKKNILSRIIRRATQARFSHTWIRYWHPLMKGDVVIDADIRGIIEVPYEPYAAHVDDVVELIPPAGIDLAKGMPALREVLGDDFDVASMVGRLWVYFCRWLGKKVRNPLGNPRKDCCVENVMRLLIPANALSHDLDAEVQDPQGIYDTLNALGWTPRPKLDNVTKPGP